MSQSETKKVDLEAQINLVNKKLELSQEKV
jgi:hypothetical protein